MPSIKSLAGRLFKLVFGWYLLLAIGVTGVQLGLEFILIRNTVADDMAALGQSFTPAVADALWTYDQRLLDSLIKGIGQASIVTGAKIENSLGNIVAKVGRLPEKNGDLAGDVLAPYQRYAVELWSNPLSANHVSRHLGQLVLYCDRDVVLLRIKYSFIVILINSLVKTLGLWLIFYWAITWRLSKPLAKLARTVETLNFNSDGAKPAPIEYREQDEVGQLVASLNDMRVRLHLAHRELEQKIADLAQARDIAEAANRAKTRFLANMSHELRTPLNAILGFSAMMRADGQLREEQRKNLAIIHHSGEHLLTLINDVLTMAKIDSNPIPTQPRAFDLAELLHRVIDVMNLPARHKGLALSLDPAAEFPRFIVADPDCLRQVLMNLIDNAIKFTRQGRVVIRAGTRSDGESRLWLEVEDTGIGIAAQDQQRIFEPFVQLGEPSLNQGSGLGLAISRHYLDTMGGDIQLLSRIDQGTRVRISFPLQQAMGDDIQPLAAENPELLSLAPGQPCYRILIVDDQPQDRLLLSELIDTLGLQVESASDSDQALASFRDLHPQLILLNDHFTRIDGTDLASTIRALPGGKAVKIVLVAPAGFMPRQTASSDTQFDAVIYKPYSSGEVYDCLATLLGLKYRYPDSTESSQPLAQLSPVAFAAVPEALRRELEVALESLDAERIDSIIARIADYDPSLQAQLNPLAEDFDYIAILTALRGQ